MVGYIDPELLAAAARDNGLLVASVSLTDELGCPRYARVRPLAVSWRSGRPLHAASSREAVAAEHVVDCC